MELISVKSPIAEKATQPINKVENTNNSFIKANSLAIGLDSLNRDCIVPVFAKDNEITVSHNQFIEVGLEALKMATGLSSSSPQIRVSHQIKGRTPDAINVPAKELKENQKTLFYERMAWVVTIPEVTTEIDGNQICLSIGGVRAYNQENLNSKKTYEKFKFFIGFQNLICLNLCISSDGTALELKSDSPIDLRNKLMEVINSFDYKSQFKKLDHLTNAILTEKQFAQIIGKVRLYQFLSKEEKQLLPELSITDNQFGIVAKDYYRNESFCRNSNGDINLWKLYNLLTEATKTSYIDTFLERTINCNNLVNGISKSLKSECNYSWFTQ